MPDRFPPPWSVRELEESFVVEDANGYSITWFHFRTQEVVGTSADRMTKAQARAMAKGFARLPELLGGK